MFMFNKAHTIAQENPEIILSALAIGTVVGLLITSGIVAAYGYSSKERTWAWRFFKTLLVLSMAVTAYFLGYLYFSIVLVVGYLSSVISNIVWGHIQKKDIAPHSEEE